MDGCCSARDCKSPPDDCHSKKGVECKANICIYPVLNCLGQACVDGHCVKAPLRLTVTPSSFEYSYAPNIFASNKVKFRATLCNIIDSDLTVSAYGEGNIEIHHLLLNGRVVVPEVSSVEFNEDPKAVQASHLVTLKPRECTAFEILTLDTISVITSMYSAFTYVPKTGLYDLQLYYQYSGTDQGRQHVFHGIVTSNRLQFRVLAAR